MSALDKTIAVRADDALLRAVDKEAKARMREAKPGANLKPADVIRALLVEAIEASVARRERAEKKAAQR